MIVLQMTASLFAYIRFTYQKSYQEYIVLICMFGGIISLAEYVVALLMDFRYFFIGEIFSIICYFYPYNFLQIVLEIKYVYFCRKNMDMKN